MRRPLVSAAEAVAFAKEAGLPLPSRPPSAAAGIKVARRREEVGELFDSAVSEATEAFGRGECYAEQFLDKPRHIEAQIIADGHGNTMVLAPGTARFSVATRNSWSKHRRPSSPWSSVPASTGFSS